MSVLCPTCGEEVRPPGLGLGAPVVCQRCHSSFRVKSPSTSDAGETAPATGATAPAANETALLPAGSSADVAVPENYDLLGYIGHGGMGTVLKARHRALNRVVAIKMPLPHQVADESSRKRFLREARTAAHLHHPNICPVYEVGQHLDRPYIAMGFIEGVTLRKCVSDRKRTPREAAEIVAKLARAVGYAHDHGVIHRDIKPANVMIAAETGEPILMDFGLAKEISAETSQLTHSGEVMGTPAYMAPEQAAGRQELMGVGVDVYALGAVLYELLCGVPPFTGAPGDVLVKVQTEEPPPPRSIVPKLHRDLETICLKALAKDLAQRYHSAVALAEDLERFCAGEAVLARRAGLAERLVRKARRNPAVTAAIAAVIVIGAVAGVVGIRSRVQAEITNLTQTFESQLDAQELTPARVQEIEATVSKLQRLARDKAAAARSRLNQRFADAIRRQINQPSLQAGGIAAINASLDLLAKRDANAAATLRKALDQRLRVWQTVFDLKPPFTDLNKMFDARKVRVDGDALAQAASVSEDINRVVETRVPSDGNVQIEATFDPAWESAATVGLRLNSKLFATYQYRDGVGSRLNSEAQQAYECLLTVASPAASATPTATNAPASFAAARTGERGFSLCLVRNGIRQRVQGVGPSQVPTGPLRLYASREGDRLTVQVNNLAPLVFQDVFPLSGDPGVFAVHWPVGGRLLALRGSRQSSPVTPSPLEHGDEMYAAGRFTEALAFYRSQSTTTHAGSTNQEARYKEGLCLFELNRLEEAAPVFNQLLGEPGDRWPGLAGCQLWLLRLRQDRQADAEAILGGLPTRFAFEQLAKLLPITTQNQISMFYGQRTRGLNYLKIDKDQIRSLEQSLSVNRILQSPNSKSTATDLANAYCAVGMEERAILLISGELALWTPDAPISPQDRLMILHLIQKNTWIQCSEGIKANDASAFLLRWLYEKPGVIRRGFESLSLEAARVQIKTNGRWFEKDVERFFEYAAQQDPRSIEYDKWADGCLLRGFLRERRGDTAGAIDAWRQGLEIGVHKCTGRPLELMNRFLLLALTGQLSQTDVENVFAALMSMSNTDRITPGLTDRYLRIVPAGMLASVVREAFRSSQGREFARQFAFRQTSFRDSLRVPCVLIFAEFIRQGALDGKVAAEEEPLVRQTAEDFFDAYSKNKLTEIMLVQFVLAWNGTTTSLGWGALAQSLEPSLRGPLAYVIAHRCLLLKKLDEAATLFATAVADAPPNSPLRKLTQEELAKLAKNQAGK